MQPIYACIYTLCLVLSAVLSVFPPSSTVPLLQLISRGSPMSFEDSNRIIPLFYLFSSLFSHSLISVHDSEFFGHELEGNKHKNGLMSLFRKHLILDLFIVWTRLLCNIMSHYWPLLSSVEFCLAAMGMWKSISVKDSEYILLLNRSDAVLHDALHTDGAGHFVPLSERCMSGNHQAGLPWDQNGAQRGVYGGLPQRGRQDQLWGSAAYPGRTETLGAALQGRVYKMLQLNVFYSYIVVKWYHIWHLTTFIFFTQILMWICCSNSWPFVLLLSLLCLSLSLLTLCMSVFTLSHMLYTQTLSHNKHAKHLDLSDL